MRYHYDVEHDALGIHFREDAEYDESQEIFDGFVIDFDKSGRPMGIDIYQNASKFVDIPRLLRDFRREEEREPMYVRDAPIDGKKKKR
jgi:uncharacterized protein YuzE